MDADFELYDGKSFKDLCKDIVANQSNRKDQIEIFIADLRPMIKTIEDAIRVLPLIKQYIYTGIANDEYLIKLAQICQRIMTLQANAEANGSSYGLSEDEKKELMKTINDVSKLDSVVVKKISKTKEKEKEKE